MQCVGGSLQCARQRRRCPTSASALLVPISSLDQMAARTACLLLAAASPLLRASCASGAKKARLAPLATCAARSYRPSGQISRCVVAMSTAATEAPAAASIAGNPLLTVRDAAIAPPPSAEATSARWEACGLSPLASCGLPPLPPPARRLPAAAHPPAPPRTDRRRTPPSPPTLRSRRTMWCPASAPCWPSCTQRWASPRRAACLARRERLVSRMLTSPDRAWHTC